MEKRNISTFLVQKTMLKELTKTDALNYLSQREIYNPRWKKSKDILWEIFKDFPELPAPAIQEIDDVVYIIYSFNEYLLEIEVTDNNVYIFGRSRLKNINWDSVSDWICKSTDVSYNDLKHFITLFLENK
jgi:hypothetical protein